MADQKFVCSVCKKEFSGKIPAKQHFESKAHQKAVQNKERCESDPHQFKCDVCDVFMNSMEVYCKHINSPRHLEKTQKAKTFASYLNNNATGFIGAPLEQIANQGKRDYDFNGERGYCHICNVELTSKMMADQHINGEKHAKKKSALQPIAMINQNVSCVVVDTCNACGESFFDQQKAEVHFAGEKHKEKIASAEHISMDTTERFPTLSTVMETSYYPTENLTCIPPGRDVKRQGQREATTNLAIVDRVCEFDGKIGHCFICDVALNSQEIAKAHLTGTRHKKALVKHRDTETKRGPNMSDSSEYYLNGDRGKCYVCDIDFTSERHARDHLSGSKHAKAVQGLADAKALNLSDTKEYEMTGNRGYCNICQLELTSTQHASQHIAGKPHAKAKAVWEKRMQSGSDGILSSSSGMAERTPETQPLSPRLQGQWPNSGQGLRSDTSGCSDSSASEEIKNENISQNQNYQVSHSTSCSKQILDGGNIPRSEDGLQDYWFSGLSGYCNLCSIDLTSRAHAMQHISGKNHNKAKLRSQNKTSSTPNDDLYCQICKVPFTGQESAQQHYNSDKHRKRVEIIKTHSSVDNPGPAPSQKVLDNTNWYPCIVCGCYLNSKEQLEIHEQSVKHKAATDGLNSLGFQENLVMITETSEERIVRVPKGSFDTGSAADKIQSFTKDVTSVNMSESSGGKFEPISLGQFESLDPASLSQFSVTDGVRGHEETLTKSVYDSNQPDRFDTLNLNQSACNLNLGSLKEKEVHKPSFLSQISSSSNRGSLGSSRSPPHSRSPSVDLHSPKHAGCDKDCSLGSHGILSSNQIQSSHLSSQSCHSSYRSDRSSLQSGNDNRMPSLEPIDDDVPDLFPNFASMSELKIKKDQNSSEKKSVNVNDFTRKNECRERQKVEVTTSEHIPVPRTTVDLSDMDSLESISSRESTPGNQTRRSEGTDSARALRNRRTHRKPSQDLNSRGLQEYESDPDKDIDSSMESVQLDKGSKSHTELMSQISQKLKDVPQRPTIPELSQAENLVSKNYKHYCSTCKMPMDTEKALQDHLKGKHHRQKLAKEPAMSRQHPPLNKLVEMQNAKDQKSFTKTVPRGYQWELFQKVLARDRICFLPTGTGKTLIACMAISAMLELNPSYQVLFLVTKVLLVLQQAKYIRDQLGNRKYKRFDPNDPSKMIDRELKIAEVCGGKQSTGGTPLWQHDIIIATAAYCENMLASEVLHWKDQCLVIFDEAHHCMKSHSYNSLMATHHYKIPKQYRCKILGLTASPAGKKDFSMTVDMLRQLQINLGESLMAIVENRKDELKAYMSNAKIHIAVMETTTSEEKFQRDLKVYLLQCYLRLAAETNIMEHSNMGLSGISKPLEERDLQRHAQDLTGDVLDELMALINIAKPNTSGVDKKIDVHNLIGHIKCICMAISVAAEVGNAGALIEIQELMATDLNQNFEFARQIGLPCEGILHSIEMQQQFLKSNLKFEDESENKEMSSSVKCLIEQLVYQNYVKWNDGESRQSRPLALILVKQRATATTLHKILKDHPEIVQRNLAVEKIVGHGGAAAERGMSVAQQRKTLEEIKDHKFQIVIATAVAEEGIDLPECELVVSMNPPSTMTALVQMRGRARKLDSHFVIVCNDKKEEAKMEDLLVREKNMMKAANFLVLNQNKQGVV
ncbi:uncharacterized protein LOC132550694 [Ylistrum balloti]|uniref:uncharacterized protein LOC132550694 n=1 Tax=Ylistrum balloti TaxID=509963 RepID=UPI002905BFA4|nr:uncharacterized protein LOC132550694 [Ylistrum balloti]